MAKLHNYSLIIGWGLSGRAWPWLGSWSISYGIQKQLLVWKKRWINILKHWFSTCSDFNLLHPPGSIRQNLDTFWIMQARFAAKHSAIAQKIPTRKNDPVQNVNGAKIEPHYLMWGSKASLVYITLKCARKCQIWSPRWFLFILKSVRPWVMEMQQD